MTEVTKHVCSQFLGLVKKNWFWSSPFLGISFLFNEGALFESASLTSDHFSSTRKSQGLPWWLSGKDSACNAGDSGSITGSGRSPAGGHANPL